MDGLQAVLNFRGPLGQAWNNWFRIPHLTPCGKKKRRRSWPRDSRTPCWVRRFEWVHVRWGEEWPTVGCWPTSRTFSPWVCGPTGRGDLNYFYQHFLWRLAIFLLSCLQGYHSNHFIKYAAFCKCACWAQELLNSQFGKEWKGAGYSGPKET